MSLSRKPKRPDTPLAPTPVVRWENNVKNPENRLNKIEVMNNRDTPVDAKPTLMNKLFPGRVTQKEYNEFWGVKADSIPERKK